MFEFLYAVLIDSHFSATAAYASSVEVQDGPETCRSMIQAVKRTRPLRTCSSISISKPSKRLVFIFLLILN